jgi:transcriptional regulator with XRE-family HTH domain
MERWERRGKVIRLLREAKEVSQARLAAVAQASNGNTVAFTKAYLSKIEKGVRNVGSEVLDAILAALEVGDDALSEKYQAEIVRDPTRFMSRETLAVFVLRDKVSPEDANALRAMAGEVGGPVDVDGWRKLYPSLTAYAKAKNTKRNARKR